MGNFYSVGVWGMFGSTSAPTGAFEEAHRLAMEGLKPLVARVQTLQNGAVKALEERLVKEGARYTPGRVIRLED